MASSWYKEFQNNLSTIGTRSRATGSGIKDISFVTPTVDTTKFSSNPNGVGEHLLDWGGRLLDVASRPGYTVGGFLNEIMQESKGEVDDVDPLEAAWAGFTGKRKEFFSPVKEFAPHEEGEMAGKTAGRFGGDLIASILADPLTYVGPGLVSGLFRALGVGKAGAALRGAAEVKNAPIMVDAEALRASDVATDTERLSESLNKNIATAPEGQGIPQVLGEPKINTGTTDIGVNKTFIPNMPVLSVNDTAGLKGNDLIQKLLETANLKKGIVGSLDSPVAQAGVSQYIKNRKFSTGAPENDLAMLTILRADMAKNLREIKGRLYTKGDFDSPWEDRLVTEAIKRPEKREFPEIPKPQAKEIPGEEIPGMPVHQQANRDAVIRYFWESADEAPTAAKAKNISKKSGAYAIHNGDIYYGGQKIGSDFAALKAHVDETIDFEDLADINHEKLDIPLGADKMTVGQLASALKQGAEKPFLADSFVTQGEDVIGLNDLIRERTAKYGERAKPRPGESTKIEPTPEEIAAYESALAAQNAEKAAYEASVAEAENFIPKWETVRPDTQSRREWIQKHQDKLTSRDRKRLNEALYRGSQSQFEKLIDDIIERETELDLSIPDELAKAVKDGRVSADEAKAFYAKFNARNASDVRARIESIDKKIQTLRGKVADKILATGDRAYDNTIPKNRKQAIAWADRNPLPAPKTPQKFFDKEFTIKRETFDSSDMRQFVEAVKDIVPAEVLGKLRPKDAELLHNSIRKALKDTYLHNRKPLPKKTFRQKTNTNDDVYNTFREFNEYKQYSFWKSLIDDIKKEIPAGAKGKRGDNARAPYVYDRAMPVLKAYDDILRAYGIHPSIEAGGKGLPMSLYDVLSSLPRSQAERFFFDKAAEITPSQWLHIAEEAYYSKIDDVRDTVGILLGDNPEPLSFAGAARYSGERARANTQKRQLEQGKIGGNFDAEQIYRQAAVEEKTFKGNIKSIITPEFVRKIKDIVSINSRRAEIQAGEFVKSTTDKMVQKFVDDMSQIRTQDELFSLVENATKGVAGFTKSSNVVPPPGINGEVADQVALATRGNPGTEIALKELDANKNANLVGDTKISGQKQALAVEDRLREMVPEYDFSKNPEFLLFGQFMHHVAPHMQESALRHSMLSGHNVAMEWSKNFSRSLSEFEREIGYERAKSIWSDIQKGISPPESQKAVYDRFHKIISEVFDSTDSGSGSLMRAGIDPAHLNSNLSKYKLDRKHFGLKGDSWEKSYNSWREWGDIEDPLNVLSRFYAAVQKTRTEKEMFDRFSLDFGSDVMKPGYGRITATRGGSRVAHLIDTRKYYPQEIIQNLHALDKTLKELAKPSSDNMLLRTFDEATHRLKSGLTIYRPGHHMRNAYGDAWLNYMDGVYKPSTYKKAWGVMAARSDHYDPETLKHIDLESFKPNGRAVTTIKINGKDFPIDEQTTYILMRDAGNLPTYASLEDLGAASTYGQPTKVNEGKVTLSAPTGGRAHKIATTTSEIRDHYFRAAHFIKLMEDTKSLKVVARPNESMDQAIRRTLAEKSLEWTARVRKWHPDGTDLQAFERNGLKRGILFYSWIRKMIPLVIESTFMRPGRALAFPKATYTFAESNGIDLNGFTDPFPADQLFPEWMGGTQGPMFGDSTEGYIGMRPGNPMMDIFDQYLSSPGQAYQTIIGATHPLIKIPYELATGATTQQVPINDLGKYAVGQVPFGSLLNTLAGKPIGGVSASDETYDPEGIRDPKAMALFNTLSGAGLIDMSKPSYIKTGEFDEKYGRIGSP
jgi:hypothetical protein